MRISDWSSDVCSSDLGSGGSGGNAGSASPPRDGNASDRHAAATPGSKRTPSGQPRPHTAWMGESWDDPDGEDEQASLAMLQQLMAGRHALLGKLRQHHPPRPRPELSTQAGFQPLGPLQTQPPSPT